MDINLVLGERINELELRWKKLTEKKETFAGTVRFQKDFIPIHGQC